MKKLFTKPLVLIVLLCTVMVSTFAVSFAYWKSGIDGNDIDKNLNINIGTGNAIETDVNLSQVAAIDKALIPFNRTPDSTQTNLIEFTVKVTWTADNLTGSDIDTFAAHTGVLTASCTKIMLGNTEVTEWEGLGGYVLFDISFDKAFYNIQGNDAQGADVTVTIIMREPATKAQYEDVAGKGITITLNFLVQSQYEIDGY